MILCEVTAIPERLEPKVVYVSRKYSTASHLCACGCGTEVVTPLGSGGWRVWEDKRGASMFPSIGNWSFPCRSHYFIRNGGIEWDGAFSPAMIKAARQADNPRAHERRRSVLHPWLDVALTFIRRIMGGS